MEEFESSWCEPSLVGIVPSPVVPKQGGCLAYNVSKANISSWIDDNSGHFDLTVLGLNLESQNILNNE